MNSRNQFASGITPAPACKVLFLPAMNRKVLLIVLDGWGLGPKPEADAIHKAHTPVFDKLWHTYPHATLVTHGEAVGLPQGQMGNSEVGHMNIGAGRIVYQELARINKAIREGELARNAVLQQALALAKAPGRKLHFLGLVSDGGVHAHIDHLIALIDIARKAGVPQAYVHAFTDGRDTDPHSGKKFIEQLIDHLGEGPVRLASIVGRYYAMDRDKRWERTKVAYDLLVHGKGEPTRHALATIEQRYAANETDEFLKPIVCVDRSGKPLATLAEGDVVIFFNFRTDRPRQLTIALTQKDMPEYGMHTLPLHYVTMTRYDEAFEGIHVLFEKENLTHTLGEVLSQLGKQQLRIAETEKYPHVTFFFNGGREEPFEGEHRILIPSPKVATYDLKPEMSAPEVTQAALDFIRRKQPDLVVLNYANTDMVGHTGVFEAAVKAAETVDAGLGQLMNVRRELGYDAIITADHGNADCMLNEDGSPNTAHSMNPVPIIYVSDHPVGTRLQAGKLGDIAPTILHIMQLETPEEMTGKILID